MTPIEFKTLIEEAEKLGYKINSPVGLKEVGIKLQQHFIYIELCLVQKWLWENHGVWVAVCIEIMHELLFYYEVISSENEYFSEEYHDTPTLALFSGLQHALTQIKK